MKYSHKCAYCSRKADNKFRGQHFCNDCKKFMRRKRVKSFLGKEKLVGYLPGTTLGIYRDIPVYLK